MYRGGYFNIPDIEDGAYPISFKNGLRGIVVDAETSDDSYSNFPKLFRRLALANPERRYLGFPAQVPPWFEDQWSICNTPDDAKRAAIVASFPDELKRTVAGARLDATCSIDADGEKVFRGMIFSIPRN